MKKLLSIFRGLFSNTDPDAAEKSPLEKFLDDGEEDSVSKIIRNEKERRIDGALGKDIECEDGKVRRVHTINYSVRYRAMAVVNEYDPNENGGAFVHLLKLFCQLEGLPPPSSAELKRYDQAVEKRGSIVERRMKKRGIAPFFGKWSARKKES